MIISITLIIVEHFMKGLFFLVSSKRPTCLLNCPTQGLQCLPVLAERSVRCHYFARSCNDHNFAQKLQLCDSVVTPKQNILPCFLAVMLFLLVREKLCRQEHLNPRLAEELGTLQLLPHLWVGILFCLSERPHKT